MSEKFHISANGEPAKCNAKIKCRLGGESGQENHFDTPEEARAAYEKSESQNIVPTVKKLKAKDYENFAKSNNADDHLKVAESGTEGSLKVLAKNKNVSEDALIKAHERAKKPETKLELELNNNFPARLTSSEGFKLLSKKNPTQFRERAKSDDITYDQIKDTPNLFSLQNPNNQLSGEDLVRLTEGNSEYRVRTVIQNEKYPMYDEKKNFTDHELQEIASKARTAIPATVAARELLSRKTDVSQGAMSRIAGNEYVSPTVLAEIADRHVDHYSDVAIANNRSADKETKALVAARNKAAASVIKLDELQEKDPELAYNVRPVALPPEGKKRRYQFDEYSIEQAKLNSSDVDTMVRYKIGDWLHSPTFNPRTGIYSGYID